MHAEKYRFEERHGPDMRHLQAVLTAEVLSLEKLIPDAGVAFVLKSHEGKTYLFANSKMPKPEGKKIQEIQGSETIVALKNGTMFRAIRLIVRGLPAPFSLNERIDLACAAIAAIEKLDEHGAARKAA